LYESDNPSLGAVFSREGEEVTVAATTHVPVEVYLRSSYEPDAEYVGKGIVFDMNQLKDLLDE
jgi:hypothetical protein